MIYPLDPTDCLTSWAANISPAESQVYAWIMPVLYTVCVVRLLALVIRRGGD